MEYFPPKKTKYEWGTVKQSTTNPYRSAYVKGVVFPQSAFLSCWETETGKFVCTSKICLLDHVWISKKTHLYTIEKEAIVAIEKVTAQIIRYNTPLWAAKAVAAGWRPRRAS
jgi:hypothetical protein